jgi:hypothetical protein
MGQVERVRTEYNVMRRPPPKAAQSRPSVRTWEQRRRKYSRDERFHLCERSARIVEQEVHGHEPDRCSIIAASRTGPPGSFTFPRDHGGRVNPILRKKNGGRK